MEEREKIVVLYDVVTKFTKTDLNKPCEPCLENKFASYNKEFT